MKAPKTRVSDNGTFNKKRAALVAVLGMTFWTVGLLVPPTAAADEDYTGRVISLDPLNQGIFRARFDEALPSDCRDDEVVFWGNALGGGSAVDAAYTLVLTAMHAGLPIKLAIEDGITGCRATELAIRKD